MIDRLKISAILGTLGLTKQEATNAFIGVVTRRIYITSFEQAANFESFSCEAKRFLGDKQYRKMCAKVGKTARTHIFGKSNVFEAFTSLADDHSMALRTVRDKFEYDDAEVVTLDDDIVDGLVADIVNIVTDFMTTGLELDPSADPTPSESPSVVPSVLDGFRNLGQHMSVTDVFPDVGEFLSPVDPKKPWLPMI